MCSIFDFVVGCLYAMIVNASRTDLVSEILIVLSITFDNFSDVSFVTVNLIFSSTFLSSNGEPNFSNSILRSSNFCSISFLSTFNKVDNSFTFNPFLPFRKRIEYNTLFSMYSPYFYIWKVFFLY